MALATSASVFGIFVIICRVKGFDFRDEIAQGICTSLLPNADYASAVSLTCTSSSEVTCATVCSEMGKVCFNSLHIYSITRSYKYNSCLKYGCGPNFCCCSDKTPPSSLEYKDKIAQATCTAFLDGADYVSAVRRQCTHDAAVCETVCKDLGKTCFESLHVYDRIAENPSDTGSVGLKTYKYNNCKSGGCGPNFCCCSG